jgi:hypothetical protein
MDRFTKYSVCGLILLGMSSSGFGQIVLFERDINQDGVITFRDDDPLVPEESGFNQNTGLGTIQLSFSGAGSHQAVLFVDHDISEPLNGYENEIGLVYATPAPSGVSWQLDDPSFGSIYSNFEDGTLANSNTRTTPADVSMAMGWDFQLTGSETATVTFTLSTTQPSGFYIQHRDPDSDVNIFFSSELTVVPELGSTGTVLGAAALATGLLLRRRKRAA